MSRRNNKRSRLPEVAVLIDSCHESSRGMLYGIFEYMRLYGPWALSISTGGIFEQQLPDSRFWKGSGVIANWTTCKLAKSIVAAKLPAVIFDITDEWQDHWLEITNAGHVKCDSTAIGVMAAEYFIKKGFTSFAFIGQHSNINWSRWRQEAFVKRLAKNNMHCHVYPVNVETGLNWDIERRHMIRWLKKLPTPIAIFAAHDIRGRQVLSACMQADIHVPYEAAVLGVDNDRLVCEACVPSLSSIKLDFKTAGYAAAELLDKLMFSESPANNIVEYPPLEVVSRLSTQSIHVNDKLVIKALEFIRINAGLNIRVSDVADHVRVSTRWLAKRFNSALERSVIDEIKRVRMETILRLVTKTTEPFDHIARKCGFASVNHLRKIFREELGQSLSEYRAERFDLSQGSSG